MIIVDSGDSKKKKKSQGHRKATLMFELPCGETREVVCFERPIGLKYTKTHPVVVTEVIGSSHAEELGVKKGWALKKIDDKDLEGKDLEYIYETLYESTRFLPLN